MSKLNLILTVLISIFLLTSQAFAFETDSVTIDTVADSTFYLGTFDNLVLDFTLEVSEAETINAISLVNGGTATKNAQIESLTLWSDSGAVGFQGAGIDKKIGDFSYFSPQYNWYLSDLVENVKGNSRFFVTAELYNSINNTATIQMQIPQFQDYNSNQSFDLGDLGIFMKSGNNGPIDNRLINSGLQNISQSIVDNWGPVARITNLVEGQIIKDNNYQIKGFARDQGIYGLKELILEIDGQKNNITDYVGVDYLWQYNWDNITEGNHTIKILSFDQRDKIGQIQEIKIAVSTQPNLPPPAAGYSYGDLIKASGAAVYYFGQDGKRYVFPNLNTYKTWYPDFLSIKTTTDLDLGTVTIGGNVTYKPGVKLVKITTDPKVYAVGANGTLRWITTEAIAIALYGANWGSLVEDVPDPFFVNYTVGAPISSASDYSPAGVRDAATSIGVDKNLGQ